MRDEACVMETIARSQYRRERVVGTMAVDRQVACQGSGSRSRRNAGARARRPLRRPDRSRRGSRRRETGEFRHRKLTERRLIGLPRDRRLAPSWIGDQAIEDRRAARRRARRRRGRSSARMLVARDDRGLHFARLRFRARLRDRLQLVSDAGQRRRRSARGVRAARCAAAIADVLQRSRRDADVPPNLVAAGAGSAGTGLATALSRRFQNGMDYKASRAPQHSAIEPAPCGAFRGESRRDSPTDRHIAPGESGATAKTGATRPDSPASPYSVFPVRRVAQRRDGTRTSGCRGRSRETVSPRKGLPSRAHPENRGRIHARATVESSMRSVPWKPGPGISTGGGKAIATAPTGPCQGR